METKKKNLRQKLKKYLEDYLRHFNQIFCKDVPDSVRTIL